MAQSKTKQDVRWFVWTVVFLVVGVGLVSYIVFSENGSNVSGYIMSHTQVVAGKTPVKKVTTKK